MSFAKYFRVVNSVRNVRFSLMDIYIPENNPNNKKRFLRSSAKIQSDNYNWPTNNPKLVQCAAKIALK